VIEVLAPRLLLNHQTSLSNSSFAETALQNVYEMVLINSQITFVTGELPLEKAKHPDEINRTGAQSEGSLHSSLGSPQGEGLECHHSLILARLSPRPSPL
jgi:hypothetical protein